jgi:hypothetical protein
MVMIAMVGLTACGQAQAPALLSTLTCEMAFTFPAEAGALVPITFVQRTYSNGSIKNTCVPKYPGMYLNIDCSTGMTVNFDYVNIVNENPVGASASLTAEPSSLTCSTVYTSAAPTSTAQK